MVWTVKQLDDIVRNNAFIVGWPTTIADGPLEVHTASQSTEQEKAGTIIEWAQVNP
jgi:hypothetical protein